jgi:hypothetical protein
MSEKEIDKVRRAIREGKKPFVARDYRGGAIFWGIFILLIGFVLLLNSLGVIPWKFWGAVWVFWPAVLLLIGARTIFGRNPVSDFIVFIFGLVIFTIIVVYGLEKIHSPLIYRLPLNIVNFVKLLQ